MIREILFKLLTLVNDRLFLNGCLERLDVVQQTVPSLNYPVKTLFLSVIYIHVYSVQKSV